MRSALSEIGRGAAVSQIDLDTFFFVLLLVTRVRQEWILEEVLVDVVDDDGSPKRQPMSWVVEEIGRAVGEVREKGCMAVKSLLLCASL